MASVKPYFDTRSPRKDGTCPLKLAVTHKGSTVLISLQINLLPGCWDAAKNEVVKDKRKAVYNDALRRRLILAENIILKLSEKGELKTLTSAELKKRIEAGENPDPTPVQISRPLVRDLFMQFIDTCKTKGTKTIYRHTLERISKFADSDTLTFEDIDASWLRKFEAALIENNKVNTVALHLRNLRAVFNRAIDEEIIPQGIQRLALSCSCVKMVSMIWSTYRPMAASISVLTRGSLLSSAVSIHRAGSIPFALIDD